MRLISRTGTACPVSSLNKTVTGAASEVMTSQRDTNALVAQRPIVIELSPERSVGLSVCPAASALWKNGGSDPDAVWHSRSDGSSDEAGGGVWRSVHGMGYFWGAPLSTGTYRA